MQLIEQLGSESFDPGRYRDEYRERALALIEQKVAGEQIAVGPSRAPKGQIIDLMEALKASLASRQAEAAPSAAEIGRKPPRAKGRLAAVEKVRKSK